MAQPSRTPQPTRSQEREQGFVLERVGGNQWRLEVLGAPAPGPPSVFVGALGTVLRIARAASMAWASAGRPDLAVAAGESAATFTPLAPRVRHARGAIRGA